MIKKLLFFGLLVISYQLTNAQAPGDTCASATALTLVPGGIYSTGSTNNQLNGNDYDMTDNCTGAPWGLGTDGVYSINVTTAGDYIFALSGGNNWNSLSVYDNCPATNGDCVGGFALALSNTGNVTLPLTAGTYYIIIDSRNPPSAFATFTLEITSPIENDEACNATVLPVNAAGCVYNTYTTTGATNSTGVNGLTDPGCAFYQGGDVWFQTTVPAGGSLIIDTTNIDFTDSGMAAYSGGACSTLTLLDCDDDDSLNGAMSAITLTGRTPGETIYIRLWEYGNNANGQFGICVTEPPPPPSNDDCSGAIPLNSFTNCTYVPYTNESATASTGVANPGCASYAGGDVWFSYVVNSTGEVTIDTNTGDITDGGMAVYSGTCGSLTLIECDDDDSANGLMPAIVLTGRTPGETLYIRVWEYGNNNNGVFSICLTSPLPVGVYGVELDCPGDTSLPLVYNPPCVGGTTSLGNDISGVLNSATDPVALRPIIFIQSADPCAFDPADDSNYVTIDFTVTITGEYIFSMDVPTPYFDSMGYIFETASGFNEGSCLTGTYIAGDDDDGPFLDPQITATLTAGTMYSLVTTKFAFGDTTHDGPFNWSVAGPRTVNWYTAPTGGTFLGTGPEFDPVGVAGSGLPDTNTPGVYTFYAECGETPGVRNPVQYIIGKNWDGSTNSDWMEPTNWSGNEVPDSSDCVYIPVTGTNPIINDDDHGDGFNLTVRNGATLTLTSDTDADNLASSLTILDAITVEGGGTLTVQDDASLIQVYDSSTFTAPLASNSGNATVIRNTSPIIRSDYVYWSSPVAGKNVNQIYGANTPTNRIYEWRPTVATPYTGPAPGFVPVITGTWNPLTSEVMDPGKGYIVRGPSSHSTTVYGVATSTFTGVPNNGVITETLDSGNYSSTPFTYNPYGGDMLTVTEFDDNWNLLGNPYPSALDAQSFLTHANNINIEGAVHIWTHGTQIGNNGDSFYDDFALTYDANDYTTFNFSGTNTYNDETFAGRIASGQGFFVLALNDNESGTVTFNNSMRDRTYSNTAFYRTNNNPNTEDTNAIEKHRIWLNLVDQNGSTSSILVGYIQGATQEKDRLYDAFAREANNLSLYSKIDDQRMIIQGRALPFDDNDQVPLGAIIPQAGEYTIAISNVDGLFLNDEQSIYLEDTYSGVIHNLRAAPYTFTVTERIEYDDRFILRYTDQALGINDSQLALGLTIIAPKGDYIKVNSHLNVIESVTVYDLLGRVLINKTTIEDTEVVLNNHNLSAGAYIVKATLDNGKTKTQKIVLK